MRPEDSRSQIEDFLRIEELRRQGKVRPVSTSVTVRWGAATPISSSFTFRWSDWKEDFPHVLVQCLVEPISNAPEGSHIKLIAPAWEALHAALSRNPDALFHLSSRQLEELVAASYDQAGFDEVILTPRSGDFGRDVIASKGGWGSIRIIDQVKAFSRGHLVDANDVRALLGVLQSDRGATKGIVTTTSDFAPRIVTDPFIAPFLPFRLELVNGGDLRNRILSLTP
ncbi:MAG: restriction endonuclease [Hydrogenophaga sp.]|uniref:restriction endonuclease n=1 Tax=Hydrogenophaga sp. TaxID=1904254 RepID=UPI00273058DD|nr:restriction endonuclease [Hydrogenophaga sp.]MDP2406997.1 restriction endonuclease [Hydrogenophaga sp.]MDZ4174225.1 restriction endonuclease [Hydrogenophaga sp.]